MTRPDKRNLTREDRKRIDDLWAAIRSLEVLRLHALPSGTQGAWLREAIGIQLDSIYRELDSLFVETNAIDVFRGRDGSKTAELE